MNPNLPSFYYPQSRESIQYKHGKPICLLKFTVLRDGYNQNQAERFGISDRQYQDAKKNFPKLPRYGEKKFNNFLKHSFDRMLECGFDFLYSSDLDLFEKFKYQAKEVFLPHMHIQMTCRKCKLRFQRNSAGRDESVWTTSKGTVNIYCVVMKISDFNSSKKVPKKERINITKKMNTPYIVIFNVKIYSSRCRRPNCRQWGDTLLYKPWVDLTGDRFNFFIFEEYAKIQHEKFQWDYFARKRLKKHRKSLCEACDARKCHEQQSYNSLSSS